MARQGFDDSKFVPYDQRPQTFNGVAVELRQPAYLPHPHPSHHGRPVPTRGVTHVMLANGYEMYECDYDCGRTDEKARAILSHLTAHNPGKNDPDYPPDLLEKIVTVAREERTRGFRSYCERAATRLNAAGLTMLSGAPFNAENVSHLYNQHKDRFPEKRRSPGRPRKSAVPQLPGENEPPRPAAATKRVPRTITRASRSVPVVTPTQGLVSRIEFGLTEAQRLLSRVQDDVVKLLSELGTAEPVDPEIIEKARLYDEMRSKFLR